MIKFTDIRRNANVLLGHEKETAIIKHSQVVGYIVPVERMRELLAAEEQYENGYLNGVADSRVGQKRIRVDLDNIKEGDTVRIKSLDKTSKKFGVTSGMLSIGNESTIDDIDDHEVLIGTFSYHIDDLELVK